jgi:hypothetical protein
LLQGLAELGYEDLAEILEMGFFEELPDGLDKAAMEAYDCIYDGLKKLSRLVVRIDNLNSTNI